MVITNQTIRPIGGKPQTILGIPYDGTNSAALQHGNKIRLLEICAQKRFRAVQGNIFDLLVFPQDNQPLIRSNIQQAIHITGTVDHFIAKIISFKHVHELVRNDLHDTLSRGRKPQISLIVRDHVFHGMGHRNVFQLSAYAVFYYANTIVRAHPKLILKLTDAIDIAQGCNRDDLCIRKPVLQLAIINLRAL